MEFTHRRKSFDVEGVSDCDHIYQMIFKKQTFYELDLLEYMRAYFWLGVASRSLGIDVGANIGNHSIYMRSFIVRNLISIEPNSQVIPTLERNLAKNIDGFELFCCALGKEEGVGGVFIPEDVKDNYGMARVRLGGAGEGSVEIKTLDSIVEEWMYANGVCSISFIKIDVEGMELDVLMGARKTLETHKPSVFVEAANENQYKIISEFLHGYGYQKLGKWAKTPVYHFVFRPNFATKIRVALAKRLAR